MLQYNLVVVQLRIRGDISNNNALTRTTNNAACTNTNTNNLLEYNIPNRVLVDPVYKKIQIFNFFEKAQKRSKLSENDIYILYIYLRLFPKYGAKVPSQKKVMGVQS